MSLDATPKGTTSNSYALRSEADAYFADRPYAQKWVDASNTDKDHALIAATDRLDRESYLGYPTLSGINPQRLQWPRTGVEGRALNLYDQDTVPDCIKEATFILALEIISANFLAESKLYNFDSIQIGPLSVKPRQPQTSGKLPAAVLRLISHVISTQPGAVRLVRG